MGVLVFPKKIIKKWDKMAINLMAHKLQVNQALGCKHWYLQSYFAGYNLFRLKDLQIINTAAIFLNYAANTTDYYSAAAAGANFPNTKSICKLHKRLKDLKLEVVINPAHIFYDYCDYVGHYVKQPIAKLLCTSKVPDVKKLIKDNKLVGLDRKSTRLNSSHSGESRMPSSA